MTMQQVKHPNPERQDLEAMKADRVVTHQLVVAVLMIARISNESGTGSMLGSQGSEKNKLLRLCMGGQLN
jgi:hypothetical protein